MEKHPLLAALFLATAASLFAKPGEKFPALTPQETAAIDAALPEDALAKPAKPRRVLVFYRTEGFVHASIPNANYAIGQMGLGTKAYTVTLSDDMAMFDPTTLNTFDAVVFNNTSQLKFENPVHRKALLDFVASGKGLIGIHAGSDNFPTWPEGQALMGGVFHSHPWVAKDTIAVKNDDPEHIINQPFAKNGFWIKEEIYQIVGPYSREKQRVLLSLDMSRPENTRPAAKIVRTDNDFPISWLKTEGKGRVFYTSLGHNKDIFEVRSILEHMLRGIQYALGDLAADAIPSAQLNPQPKPALAPDDKATLQDKSRWFRIIETHAKYEYGDPLAPLMATEQKLRAASPQERLAAENAIAGELMINRFGYGRSGTYTLAAEKILVNWLGWIGTQQRSIDILARLMKSFPELAHDTSRALAALNSPSGDQTLLPFITDANPEATRIEALNSLGQRRSSPTVADIAKLTSDKNPDISTAALEALASIATPDAVAALHALPLAGDQEIPRARALIAATASLLRRDPTDANRALAIDIHGKTLRTLQTLAARVETAQALVSLDPTNSALFIFPVDSDARLRNAVACGMAASGNPAAITILADNFPHIALDTQRRMMAALATTPSAAALPLVNQALASPDIGVQLAAITAAGSCGNNETVAKLLPSLASENKTIAAAAFAALTQLPDDSGKTRSRLSGALAKAINGPENPKNIASLLRICASRQDRQAIEDAFPLTKSGGDEIRAAAFEAVALLVRPGDLPQILPLSAAIKRAPDRREWLKALYNSAALHPDAPEAVALLQKQIASTKSSDRSAMIAALTMVQSPGAKAALNAMLTDPDASVRKETIRALSSARSQTAYELLLERMTAATEASERLLAQRGAIDTVDQLDITARDKVSAYRKLWKSATTPEARDAIIAAVRNVRHGSATAFIKEIAPEK